MMRGRSFSIADARLERSPGQDADILVGNVVDEHDGAPVTIGYGRYAPGQVLAETMAVDDVMIILEGRISVTAGAETVTAASGQIIHMPKGEAVRSDRMSKVPSQHM